MRYIRSCAFTITMIHTTQHANTRIKTQSRERHPCKLNKGGGWWVLWKKRTYSMMCCGKIDSENVRGQI